MGRKEQFALIVAGIFIFLIVMKRGYAIWFIVGIVAFVWFRKRR